jgi:hypothetical protein
MQGDYYRLLTSMFMHANLLHILFNMTALFSVGRTLEPYFGRTRFLLVYLGGGLCGSAASALLNTPLISSVGASGAVFAIFGAAVVYDLRYRDLSQTLKLGRSGSVIAINLFNGLRPDSGIDNWAHLGGVVGGALIAWASSQFFQIKYDGVYHKSWVIKEWRKDVLRGASVMLATLIVLLVGSAFASFSPRQITVGNIEVTTPSGWQVVTDFGEEAFCKQAGVECLLVAIGTSNTYFEVDRFTGSDVSMTSLDDFDQSIVTLLDKEGYQSISQRDIEVDGNPASRHEFTNGNETRIIVLIRKDSGIVRLYVQSTRDELAQYQNVIESTIASIHFVSD